MTRVAVQARRGPRALATFALFVAGALLTLPARAPAFVRSVVPYSNTCLYWNARALGWAVADRDARDVSLTTFGAAARSSFEAWESVDCSDLAFVELGPTPERRAGYESSGAGNENLLIVRDRHCDEVAPPGDDCQVEGDCGNAFDCWDYSDTVIAVTTTTFDSSTGEIVDADVEFNGSGFRFTALDGPPCATREQDGCVATDLQNTTTHEIGHMLGLDHTPVTGATMQASAPLGEIDKRTLEDDDRRGLCNIYPDGGPTAVCVVAERPVVYSDGCACSGASGGPFRLLPLGLFGLALLALRAQGGARGPRRMAPVRSSASSSASESPSRSRSTSSVCSPSRGGGRS